MKKLLVNPMLHGTALLAGAAFLVFVRLVPSSDESPAETAAKPLRSLTGSRHHQAGDHGKIPNASRSEFDRRNLSLADDDILSKSRNQIAPGMTRLQQRANPPSSDVPLVSRSGRHTRHAPSSDSLESIPDGEVKQEPATDAPLVLVNAPFPVALALPELETSGLSLREQSLVRQVQSSFTASIAAAPSHDPESAVYFNYWKSAAYLHDEQLRITLGWTAFNRLSALAAQTAERNR